MDNLKNRFTRKQQPQPSQQPKTRQPRKEAPKQQIPTEQKLDKQAKTKVQDAVKSLPERDRMKAESVDKATAQHTPNTKTPVDKDKPHRSIEQNKRVYDPNIPKQRQQAKERDKGRSL